MSLLSQVLALFPSLVMLLVGACFGFAIAYQSVLFALAGIVLLYGLPVFAFRVHDRFFPLKEGASHLVGTPYSPWWGGHQLQLIFISFPMLEDALRLVPGLFSAWLRLWGSTVGESVYWTPRVQIGDRSLLEIGDRVIWGYDAGVSSHLVKKTRKNVLLLVKRVVIEDDVFLGAGVRIGPGVRIKAGTVIDAGVALYPNKTYPASDDKEPRARPNDKDGVGLRVIEGDGGRHAQDTDNNAESSAEPDA